MNNYETLYDSIPHTYLFGWTLLVASQPKIGVFKASQSEQRPYSTI